MYLYCNYRKKDGAVSWVGLKSLDNLGKEILPEIEALVKNDNIFTSEESKALLKHINVLKLGASLEQVRYLIKKYEEVASPVIGQALYHDIEQHKIISDH